MWISDFAIRRPIITITVMLAIVAFGWAAHFCFGAHLARLEGQIALATILRRLPNLALDTAMPLVWRPNLGLRGLTALPVRFDARPSDEQRLSA